jgi:hypothetical protein
MDIITTHVNADFDGLASMIPDANKKAFARKIISLQRHCKNY